MTLTRTRHIPTGSLTVRDKASDVVAYLYTTSKGRPAAIIYGGRRTKPDAWLSYANEAARERSVRSYFEAARAAAERRKARQQRSRKLEVGHILTSSWGYEQTNVDFYQVTALIGSSMVELRKIASNHTKGDAWMQGQVCPVADAFTGEPIRRRANGDGVRIDDVRWATIWSGRPVSWTGYH